MSKTLTIGNSRISLDTSYIDQLTAEQERANLERLKEACWAIIDEITERGEAV